MSIEEDRAKGLAVLEKAASYEEALRVYYGMVDDLPEWRKEQYVARKLGERVLGREICADAPVGDGPMLDLGCGTGGVALAAAERGAPVVAVDVAFRWLVIARMQRLASDGAIVWICANAEALPFADGSFRSVVAVDLVEHLTEPDRGVAEMARVLAGGTGSGAYLETNNRWSWLPEPHVRLPWVGWLPRVWQLLYVRWLRGMDYSRVRLMGGGEVRELLAGSGFAVPSLQAAPVRGAGGFGRRLARGADALLGDVPGLRWMAARIGILAHKGE